MKKYILTILFTSVTLMGLSLPHISRAAEIGDHTHPEADHSHGVEPHTHKKRPHIHDELQQIKLWLAEIERNTERRPLFKGEGEEGEKRGEETFPLQSRRRTQINGGMTLVVQGGLDNPPQFVGNRPDGSLSIDMILSSEIRKNGLLIIRGGFMRGEGLTQLPPLFAGGVNADIEDFSPGAPDTFHLIEALYEQTWQSETFRLSFGQIDLTSYFDQNQFANSETFQFLSPAFVNNIEIAWGGDVNAYGPGLVLHVHPLKVFEINLGLFGNDGKDVLDEPFWIVEVEYEVYSGDLEGHYRLNYWSNEATLVEGIGISFDQDLCEVIGIWGRFGLQEGEATVDDRHVSFGAELKGPGRSDHVLGVAVGMTWVSDNEKSVAGLFTNEYLGEVYYNISVGDGFYLTPDFQYISNPGGNGAIDPISIYGIRGQLDF